MIVLVALTCAYGAVDVVGCSWGNFVAWGDPPGISYLAEIEGSQDTLEFGQYYPTLGFAVIDGEPRLIITTSSYLQLVDDTLYLIDPSPLSVVTSRAVASTDLCWLSEPDYAEGTIQAARHQNEEDAFYVSADAYLPISGDMQCNVISARFQCDTSGDMYITDTLGVSMDTYYGSINSYSRPVCCGSSTPTQLWSYHNGFGTPCLSHHVGVHQINGDPVSGDFEPMLYGSFHYEECDGEIRAVGSCMDEVLGFWTTANDTELWYSMFQPGDTTAVHSEPAPYDIPVLSAIAMSANPLDYGLLLVWQDAGEIRCAHWNGEWNSYHHVVETGVPDLFNGDLAVCSIDSGYVVAWSSTPVPETRFIQRDDVTSVGEAQETASGNGILITPNPVAAGYPIMIRTGSAPAITGIEVYDLHGRLMAQIEPDKSGATCFNTSEMPPGTYIVRSRTANGDSSQKIILLCN